MVWSGPSSLLASFRRADELLTALGQLADESGHLVQTHCSENDWEHGYVLDRHQMTDTKSLHSFGLLRKHAVLAHGCLLEESDLDLISQVGSALGLPTAR